MNYELALKLKEAGYPQPWGAFADGTDRAYYLGGGLIVSWSALRNIRTNDGQLINYVTEASYIPTLEELIEACVDDFACLRPDGVNVGGWVAECDTTKKGIHGFCIEGKTPSEAVANLWLELRVYVGKDEIPSGHIETITREEAREKYAKEYYERFGEKL